MTESKNQHYVPKFMLRKFSKNNKQINCYVLKTKKHFLGSIKNQCSKDYFYSKDVKHEQHLSKIEAKQSVAINKVLKEESLSKLSNEELARLLQFASLAFARTLRISDKIKNTIDLRIDDIVIPQVKNYLKERGFCKNDIDEVKITTCEKAVRQCELDIGLRGNMLLTDLKLLVLINKSKILFIKN